MDDSRFDALVRTLDGGRSRRAVVGLLAALGLAGLDEVSAKKKRKKEHKKKKHKPPPSPPCATTCAGCCDNGSCKAGTAPAACGVGGVSCTACAAGEGCQDGECVKLPCGAGGPCLVFVTSTTDNGNISADDALEAADSLCQELANKALPALPGAYKAWLSAEFDDPANRFVQSTGPYRLVNGTTIANTWADLTDGMLLAPINLTESGGVVADPVRVWTGTDANGTGLGMDCADWSNGSSGASGYFGIATATSSAWSRLQEDVCGLPGRLYCFQQS
jgi:hypothetical protein